MSYEVVTGTSGSNILLFKGILGPYGGTLVNPYSGYTITISPATKNINNAIYDGLGGNDTISMTELGDVLTLVDAEGTVMVKNVEAFNAGLDGDIIILAHATVTYGNVTIRGSDGDDLLWSNVGNDLIQSGAGDDIVDGGGGNDNIFGGSGNDYLAGGLGRDLLAGGEGDDTLVYSVDGIWSDAYTLADLGSFLSFASSINLGGYNRSFDTYNGDATETLATPTVGHDTLVMTSGNDVLSISDTITPGSPLLSPRVGYLEIIDAGAGDDIVDLTGQVHKAVTIYGGDGNDLLAGSDGDDIIYGDAGNDRLAGSYGTNILYGGAGNDTYYYDGQSADTVIESSGNRDSIAILYYTLEDLTLTVQGLDLVIDTTGYSMTIKNHYAADLSGRVEKLVFDDGSDFDLTTYYENKNPIARDDVFSGDKGTTITGNVLANDSDDPGETLTVIPKVVYFADGVVILEEDGSFIYETDANYSGTNFFNYTVYDDRGGSSTAQVTLNVININHAPIAQDDIFWGDRFSTVTGNVLEDNGSGPDSDVDLDALSVQAGTITTASGGSVAMNADGSFVYTAVHGFYGADTFDYTLLDGQGGSDTATSYLNIAYVEDPYPEANNDEFFGVEDQAITGNVILNDSDPFGDALVTTAGTFTSLNSGTVVVNTDGSFVYTPDTNFYGTDLFEYELVDENGNSSFATVTLNVSSVNDNPTALNDHYFTGRSTSYSDNVLIDSGFGADYDVDGDALSVQAGTYTTLHNGTVVLNANGSFTYTPASGFVGTDGFDYTLLDGQGGSDIGSVTIDVTFFNADPIAVNDSFSGKEDKAIEGNVLDNDIDDVGDVLSVVPGRFTTANGGVVRLEADGSFSYRGEQNFNGTDSFNYTVLDNQGGSSSATVTLSVSAVNDAPVAADDQYIGLRNNQIVGNVLVDSGFGADFDVDGDTLSVHQQTITTAHGGTVNISADGSFTYTPKAGFYGTDGFDYILDDGMGGTDTGSVSLTVNIEADAIVGTDAAETVEGTLGDDKIFGLDGDDILYGDTGALYVPQSDKVFADTEVMPDLVDMLNIGKLKPSGASALGVADGNLSVAYDATAKITFRATDTHRDNSLGTFMIAADGTIKAASLEWANVKTAAVGVEHQIDLPVGENGGDFGFFILSNGNTLNNGYAGLNIGAEGNIKFIYNYGKANEREAKVTDSGKRVSVVYDDGHTKKVLAGDAYFTTERGGSFIINNDNRHHVVSGLVDANNLTMNFTKSDLALKPVTITKDGITLTALTGKLIAADNGFVGIQSKAAAGGKQIGGDEAMRVSFAGSEKVAVTLNGLTLNTGIDFKIYMNGDMDHPVPYEHAISLNSGRYDIILNASMFGPGLITAIDISSVANSALAVEDSFWLSGVKAFVPGGVDTDFVRIGFEDGYRPGDSDYNDVVFDLDIDPVDTGPQEGGDDFLDGGAGNDLLYGEGGDDILALGLGLDTGRGGDGADTFAITLVDSLADVIQDFDTSEGDVINVTDVLDGYDPISDDIANFIQFVQNGDDTEIRVNADGVGTDFVTAAIVLGGVDDDLATMIANGSLVANQSALS